MPIDNVAFTNCDLNGTPATIAVTNTAASPWLINVNHDSGSPIGTLKIPANGAVVTAGTCTIDVDQSSEITNIPYSNSTGVASASNSGTINFTSTNTGSTPCPPSGTATLTGNLQFDPIVQVLDAPQP
ncbi:hypothetical protein [Tomitella cavernea]|uniref:Uncharacterized protein n=1 Tax=Tomitella cavernea TaxID=1387982 RepID=A0ABP9CF90_9ACTN|nr:hypothetical protein [Tomitella cavernea]